MFSENTSRPKVISTQAQIAFEKQARSMGFDPKNQWVGGYVDYEWDHLRLLLESYNINPKNLTILEFGCNVGASAVIFAQLGAKVCAIDISQPMIDLAKLNSERYGISNINFLYLPDTRKLPYQDEQFNLVNCNSVLEYIDISHLHQIQIEIDRTLKPEGNIVITGTSNRLWPREVHSQELFVNYIPRMFDRFFPHTFVRGISPWSVRNGFGPHYINLDAVDHGRAFLHSRTKMGSKSKALIALIRIANLFNIGPGILAPNISCILKKNGRRMELTR